MTSFPKPAQQRQGSLGWHEVTTDATVPSRAETTVEPVPLEAGQVTFHRPTFAPQLVEADDVAKQRKAGAPD